MADNDESLWASPLGASVVGVLRASGEWMTKEKIAEALGGKADSRLGVILWEYVERKVLESDSRLGYRYRRVEVPAAK